MARRTPATKAPVRRDPRAPRARLRAERRLRSRRRRLDVATFRLEQPRRASRRRRERGQRLRGCVVVHGGVARRPRHRRRAPRRKHRPVVGFQVQVLGAAGHVSPPVAVLLEFVQQARVHAPGGQIAGHDLHVPQRVGGLPRLRAERRRRRARRPRPSLAVRTVLPAGRRRAVTTRVVVFAVRRVRHAHETAAPRAGAHDVALLVRS
mmetsp:Transcript_11289/g.47346  ORF Transcript_11289/g.47346 Transcript_11289/m.47346 type:complete len:207 (-) Transcript_11289:703-1323(-)